MESLILEATDDTPYIHFDKVDGKFEISGKSLPEDIMKFYGKVNDWLSEYMQSPNEKTKVNFKMVYFNSSSSKVLGDLISIFEEMEHKSPGNVCIYWHYNQNDDEMKEAGEEFADVYKVPFEFISYSESV